MNIIEKLGIPEISSYKGMYGCNVCDEINVRELEQQKNELLKALIDLTKNTVHGKNNPDGCVCGGCMGIRAIEKACYPKKWKEIKELSNA